MIMKTFDFRVREDLVPYQPMTPWGVPCFYLKISDGLSFVGSGCHGGYRLSQDFAERILPPELLHLDLHGYHYFEQDRAWILLLLFLRDTEPELYAAIGSDRLNLSSEELDLEVNGMVHDHFIDYVHYLDGRTVEYLYVTVPETASQATSYLVSCAEKFGRNVGTVLRTGNDRHHSVKVTQANAYLHFADRKYADRYYEVTKHLQGIAELSELFDYRIVIRIRYDHLGTTCFRDVEISANCLQNVLRVRNLSNEEDSPP